MSYKEEMKELRQEINSLDDAMLDTFGKRMELSKKVAVIKRNYNMAVQDIDRENEIVKRAVQNCNPELKSETALLMRNILALSCEYQNRLLFSGDAPMLPASGTPVTENIICAHQGVRGAWSEQASVSLFPDAELKTVSHFEDVFTAVKNGDVHYGVVPIENSETGAIGETYDLLRKYGCYIVGRTWISIRQNLVGTTDAEISDIREVLSHPEGLKQCSRYLQNHPWEQTACRNTAVAAQKVAEENDKKKAAISSVFAAELYGLKVLAPDIMDSASNRTSFVVIAKQPEYDETSDLISVTFSTQHRSGALCETLMAFIADNLNLMRIESRPAASGKYRFFVEIQGNINDSKVLSALRHAAACSEYFEVLGCYSCSNSEGSV